MAYEQFKEVKDREQFFSEWDPEQLQEMSKDTKDRVYNKYLVKCATMQRDDFTCQNENCPFCNNEREYHNLTMHHIRFQKNNGPDKSRNCVIICRDAHKGFHRGKNVLTFWGHTYKVEYEPKTDWKQIKAEKRKLRKQVKDTQDVRITWSLLRQLMIFLFSNVEDDSLEDDLE